MSKKRALLHSFAGDLAPISHSFLRINHSFYWKCKTEYIIFVHSSIYTEYWIIFNKNWWKSANGFSVHLNEKKYYCVCLRKYYWWIRTRWYTGVWNWVIVCLLQFAIYIIWCKFSLNVIHLSFVYRWWDHGSRLIKERTIFRFILQSS
jgi:hypothetical protein